MHNGEDRLTMRFPVVSLVLLPLLIEATPWRASSPIGMSRLPLVVAKDMSSRSLSSLSSYAIPTLGASSSAPRKVDSDDGVRGGSTIPADSDAEDRTVEAAAVTGASDIEVAGGASVSSSSVSEETADTAEDAALEKAHHSHIKKRRRRKKDKLDGPHALYAKKLKVRMDCS